MRTLLLIDANSIIHRSFHALPPLTNKTGAAVGSIYGLSSILLRLWRDGRPAEGEARPTGEARFGGRPDYAAALFDRPEPTFREKKYKEYKAQRPPAPGELIYQIIEAPNLFEAFGIKTLSKAGFEADDLIATLAEKFRGEPDLQIVILTGDRDTLQLVDGEKIVVRTFKTGVSDTLTYDEKMVMEKYGLTPSQIVDYKALVGDPSDNIKGVPGIGPKTATEILQKFGTLDNAFKNIGSDAKLEKRIGPYKAEAELSRMLVILERNVPTELKTLDELATKGAGDTVKNYFEKMGFQALIRRLTGEEIPARKEKSPEKRKPKPMF